MSTYTSKDDVIRGAASVARDAAEGRLDPADLEAVAVRELTELFADVSGRDSPIFPLQCAVARSVLAAGAIESSELQEWLAVQRASEEPAKPRSVPEPSNPDEGPCEATSVLSDAPSAQEAAPDADLEPVAEPVAPVTQLPPQRKPGEYDPLHYWPAAKNGFVG
jgi:hypothetical protein